MILAIKFLSIHADSPMLSFTPSQVVPTTPTLEQELTFNQELTFEQVIPTVQPVEMTLFSSIPTMVPVSRPFPAMYDEPRDVTIHIGYTDNSHAITGPFGTRLAGFREGFFKGRYIEGILEGRRHATYNPFLYIGKGWIFPQAGLDTVLTALNSARITHSCITFDTDLRIKRDLQTLLSYVRASRLHT